MGVGVGVGIDGGDGIGERGGTLVLGGDDDDDDEVWDCVREDEGGGEAPKILAKRASL